MRAAAYLAHHREDTIAMWICARCGTEAQRPEICSGCGSSMKPFDSPPKEERFKFVLIAYKGYVEDGFDVFGPFPSVMAADAWAEAHLEKRDNHEVVLMEAPDGQT